MARSIIGVIVGYVVMFIVQVAAFMTIYTIVGPDWSFEPASFRPSVKWTVMQMIVIFVTAAIAGLVCAIIAKGGKAYLVLAAIVLALGLGLGALSSALKPADTHEVRTGSTPNMEAMSKAQHPLWVVFLGAFVGAAGVVAGGKMKRSA